MQRLPRLKKVLTLVFIALCLTAEKNPPPANPRVEALSGEDLEMFNALTKEQQKNLKEGVIKPGDNAWMSKIAFGPPYYDTEHHPIYTEYEQVWLYTKEKRDKDVTENKIIDPETNWPTIHRLTREKTCTVGDFFVLFDRGVVDKIVKDNSEKIYGSCQIHMTEEFLPIVSDKAKKGKP